MRKYLFAFLTPVIMPFYLYADTGSNIETESVKVTASKIEKELQDVPASVSVITAEDIEKASGRTVGELLFDIPGVQVVNSGGQGLKRISLRAEGVNRTLILIDGHQNFENKSMEGTPLLIDPALIERIEVIRGPSSVLYGSHAIGGVINIITKKGGKKPVEGSITGAYNGASAGHSESASIFGKVKGFEYRVTGSFNEQGQLRTPIGLVKYSSFKQQNYGTYLAYNFNDNFKAGLLYDYFEADILSGSQARGYENFYVKIPEWSRHKATAFFEAKNLTSYLSKLRLDVFYQQSHKLMQNHVEIDPAVLYMPAVIDNFADNYNNQWGLVFQSDWMIGDHTYLIAGYDFYYNILNADTVTDSQNTTLPVMNYNKYLRNEGYEYYHALYIQGESYLPADFTLSYGARWTYHLTNMEKAYGSQYYKDTGLSNILGPESAGYTGISAVNSPVFTAGILWSGIENFTIRLNFSQGFRAPSLQEKYLFSSMGGGVINPNPNLKPETSNNIELGFRYNNFGVNLDAVYFVSFADNYIAKVPVSTGSNETIYRNVSSAFTHGAELVLSYKSKIGLKPYVSLAVTQRRYDDNGVKTWKTGVPLAFGRGGLIYETSFNKSVNFKVDLFSRFSSEVEDSLDSVHSEITGNLYYAPWATANIALSLEFGEKRQYAFSGEVNNIFNKLYQTSVDIYEPGLYGAVKFSAKF